MSVTTTFRPQPARRSIAQSCDDLALLVLAAASFVVLLTFKDYGLGWDDYTHAEYADLLIELYRSGFRDTRALSFVNLYMYGGGFDVVAALMHKILPFDLFETRRLAGGAIGLIGAAVTWRLARRVGGPVAGVATLVVLMLCPTYYGHIFMNPKDVPFAVAMVIMLYGLVRLAEEYPAPDPRTVLVVGFGAGLALGSRVLGGLALVYAIAGLVPIYLDDMRTHGARTAAKHLGTVFYALLPGLVFGYLVMGLIWPWSVLEPLNPIKALEYFSHFFEKPWKELFDGKLTSVPDMPWSYLPTQFGLRLPEITLGLTLAGAAGALIAQTRTALSPRRRAMLLMIVLAAFLPLMVAIIKRPALYNGVRHFVFVVPPMAVLAGVAFAWIMDRLSAYGRAPVVVGSLLVAAGLALPLNEMIRLHPYQYTYFNHAAGRVRAANNRYMLDYWGLAFKQASDELRAYLDSKGMEPPQGRRWKIAVCGPQRPAQVALGPDFAIGWDSHAADFAMTLNEFYCKQLNAPVMVQIERDDVVFARVYDIRGRSISTLLAIPPP